jgi:glycosyltransferase 2 family protein
MVLTWKKVIRGIFFSLTVSVVSILLINILSQSNLSLKMFYRINPFYLIIAALITFSFWLMKSLKLRVLAHTLGLNLSIYRVFSIYIASVFVANVTPSSTGALPFQIFFLYKEGLPLGKTTVLTVLDAVITFLFFLIITPVLILNWGMNIKFGVDITQYLYIAVIIVLVFIAFIIILIFNTHIASLLLNKILGIRLLEKILSKERVQNLKLFMEREINYFNEGLSLLLRSKEDILMVLVYTGFYVFFYLSLAPVLLRGLGVSISISSVVLGQLVFNIIQPLIPTPGGSGLAELGFAYLFKFMVPAYLLGIFVLLWRFFMFYLSLSIGGLYFIYLVRGSGYLDN